MGYLVQLLISVSSSKSAIITMTNNIELVQKAETNFLSVVLANLLLPLGVFFLSLAGILIRLSEQEIGPNATIFNRLWITTLFFGIWLGIQALRKTQSSKFTVNSQSQYRLKDWLELFLQAIFSTACLVTWAWSLTETNVANSVLFHNLTPLFAIPLGWLFLQHYFDSRFLAGSFTCVIGVLVISIQDFHLNNHFQGDAIAFLSAIFYALTITITEKLRAKFATSTILFWSCLLGSLITLPLSWLLEDHLFPYSGNGWLSVLGLAFLCNIAGQGILAYCLKQFSSAFVSLCLLLEPLITAVLAWLIFAERLSLLNSIAFIAILSGLYLAKSGYGAEKT